MLFLFGFGGAVAGFLVQHLLGTLGLIDPLLRVFVHYQGDLAALDPATGQPFDPANMLANWPQLFFDLSTHLGWIFGLIAGAGWYFKRYGQWRSGSSLLMHLTLGSLLTFLIGPVLLSNVFMSVGGFRMMPPRGDSWANSLGVYIGMLVYMYRNNLVSVACASLVSGVVGGLGFMLAQFTKILMFMPGSPLLTDNQETIQSWAHWRNANWHSICTEQGAGLLYGLGIAIAMGLLASRVKPVDNDPPVRRWTEVFSVGFILNVLLFVNLIKNVEEWNKSRPGGYRAIPEVMKAPLFQSIELSAWTWFTLIFLLMTICTVALLVTHLRRPLAVVPSTWLGKGQLFYLVFLWAIVIGNFERALVGFTEQRLATEGVITVHALIATFLLLFFAREKDKGLQPLVQTESGGPNETPITEEPASFAPMIRRTVATGVAVFILFNASFTAIVHSVYGDKHDGWGGRNVRFGPEADWRVKPILKNKAHR